MSIIIRFLLATILIGLLTNCADSIEQVSKPKGQKPIFTMDANYEVLENTTEVVVLSAYDPDKQGAVSFRIIENMKSFKIINNNNTLEFITAPDFENPKQRLYKVKIQATDVSGMTELFDIQVSILNTNDIAPIIEPDLALLTVKENNTFVSVLSATDKDQDNNSIQYYINPPTDYDIPTNGEAGPDQNLFTIKVDATNKSVLEFINPPDFETKIGGGNGGLGIYSVTLYAGDTQNLGFRKIKIIVDDVLPSTPLAAVNVAKNRLVFSWQDDPEAVVYEMWADPDGVVGPQTFTKMPINLNSNDIQYVLNIGVHKIDWLNALYQIKACEFNSLNCKVSKALPIKNLMLNSINTLVGSNTKNTDNFGSSISISADGKTIAVGALSDSNSFQGVCNGPGIPDLNNQIVCLQRQDVVSDNQTATNSGAVYIFRKLASGDWSQIAYIKAANARYGDKFGWKISLNGNGSQLAVSAPFEDGTFSGIVKGSGKPDAPKPTCSDQVTIIEDDCTIDSGVVYIFARDINDRWSQVVYLKSDLTTIRENFGRSLAWSSDGSTLAVSKYLPNTDPLKDRASAVFIFNQDPLGDWKQTTTIQATNIEITDGFATEFTLSSDGTTLVVGAPFEDGSSKGVCNAINCDITTVNDNLLNGSGAVYVFKQISNKWFQQAYIKASNNVLNLNLGMGVSLSGDGLSLVVGAPGSINTLEGVCNIQGAPNNSTNKCAAANTIDYTGAAYYFTSAIGSGVWTQQAYIKPANTGLQSNALVGDRFGNSVSISLDGKTIAISSPNEDGSYNGVNYGAGNKDEIISPIDCLSLPVVTLHVEDNCMDNSGAVYVFNKKIDNTWAQQSYIKNILSLPDSTSLGFSKTISLSGNGQTLVTEALDKVNVY